MIQVGEAADHGSTLPVVEDGGMQGYDSSSYGDAFADVYDDWYRDISDIDATVDCVAALARSGRVLELGVGTGRLALPLAARGCTVTGIDSSARMLEHLALNDPDRAVTGVHGDMVDDLPAGPFDVALVAYNTLFNLLDPTRQADCFARVADVLDTDGVMVVEAFVPQPHTGSQVSVRTLAADRVVLSASLHDATTQRAEGQFIEFTEAGGVRLRPWAIRYSTPAELDAMAARAGLALRDRWSGFDRAAFTDDSPAHVSVYARSVAG